MPELPEVETTVRELKKKLVGLKFVDVWSDREKPLLQAGGTVKMRKEIKGKKILKVWRRAKFIVIDIEGPKSIFIHQKISGHLLYGKLKRVKGVWQSMAKGPIRDDPKNKYLRIVFTLSNGFHLTLSDLRRFGRVLLVDDKNINNLKAVSKLGPEPLDVSYKEYRELFRKKKGRIKPVLMDPFFIVGIGNIYADEILWESGLHTRIKLPLTQGVTTTTGLKLRYPITAGTVDNSVITNPGITGTTDWTRVQRTFTTAADYSAGRLDLLYSVNAGATAWFDDIAPCEDTQACL